MARKKRNSSPSVDAKVEPTLEQPKVDHLHDMGFKEDLRESLDNDRKENAKEEFVNDIEENSDSTKENTDTEKQTSFVEFSHSRALVAATKKLNGNLKESPFIVVLDDSMNLARVYTGSGSIIIARVILDEGLPIGEIHASIAPWQRDIIEKAFRKTKEIFYKGGIFKNPYGLP